MTEQGWGNWQNRSGIEALTVLAPDAAVLFNQLSQAVALPPDLSTQIRHSSASALGLTPLGPAPSSSTLPATPAATSVGSTASMTLVRFAQQFAVDVSIIDDDSRREFTEATGQTTFGAILTIWIADMVPRVRALLDRVFDYSNWAESEPVVVKDSELWATVGEFIRVVHNIDGLDPVLSEIVRLRGAREHNCRLCKSLRSRSALIAGADEELFDSIDSDGQHKLSDKARTSTALVDAFIWHPTDISGDLIAQSREQFSPAETVELVLDVMRNAANKIAVALGADAPNVAEGIDIYDIDDAGVAHYGLSPGMTN